MEIKVGDKVRVREDAPKIFSLGWYGCISNVVNIEDGCAKIECRDCVLVIPLKYLIKVEDEAKEPKFKEGDKVIFKGFVCTIIGIVYNKGAFAGYIIESPKLYGDITVPESDLEPYTEPTEEREFDGITEESANKLSDILESYGNAMENIKTDSYWTAYTADLAKEIAIVYAKQKRDVRMAVRAAKSVVEELKKK